VTFFSYYSVSTFSNVYIVGCASTGKAAIIDPARFEVPLLEFIESRGMELTDVLVTRPEADHAQGVRTLRRIYDAEIHAGIPEVAGMTSDVLEHGRTLTVGKLEIQTIGMPAHSQEAFSFRLGHLLFSGPVLAAGSIGFEHPGYGVVLLQEMIHERLLELPASTVVLPRSGPPSTIGLERETNPELRSAESQQASR
jgi:glyoxylase-like metal-dependent hydrolase (beta-lactamase superfamily II)